MTKPLVFLLVLSSFFGHAQKKIASIAVSDKIVFATVDRAGELYAVTAMGQIQKFDVNGKLLSVYKNGPAPTLFEPRDGSRLFAFFRTERKIEYLDPTFEVYDASVIDSAFVVDPWLACAFGDHNILVIDAADQTLKKINPRASTVEVDVKLPDGMASALSDIHYVREYQGFIFLLDRQKGIHIFNGMGRWIKTIPAKQLPYFNFIGEELYFPKGDNLHLVNLFSGEERQIPLSKPSPITLLTDERLFIIQSNSIDFFEFKP
jgi:hypothetical protein